MPDSPGTPAPAEDYSFSRRGRSPAAMLATGGWLAALLVLRLVLDAALCLVVLLALPVLWLLLRASGTNPYAAELGWGTQLMRTAARIAINRTVAGVHFPVDSAAGAVLGLTLGHYLVARCQHAASFEAWKFDGTKYP